MESVNKMGLEGGDSRSVEERKKKKIGECNDDNVRPLPSTTESNEETYEDKLLRETCYLTDLNKFFPDLVWKRIMTYVVDKADIESCSNASPYFGNLLYSKRYEEIVVPETLSVLYKYYQNNSTDEDETNPMKDILTYRLLCKAWNRIIEGLHDDDERSYFEMKNEFENPANKNIETWVVDSFDNLSGAEKFLEHFNPTHLDSNTNQPKRNPFLGRYVHLFYDRNDGDNVDQSFTDMLKIYGQGIWYFSLFYHFPPGLAEQDGNRLVELYREVCEMIRYMPRLRVFRFFYKEQIEEHEIPFDNRPTLQPSLEETRALNREMDRNPLPKFQNLECLVTVDLPSPIFNQLLHRNSADIRQMEITRKRFHQDYELFGAEGLQNLKTLSLEFLSVEDFKQFENCPLTFKLQKFHCLYDQSAEFLPWSRVFQALESKIDKDVCSEMVLQMPLPRNDAERLLVLRESLDCRLDFPKLKRILIFEQTALCLDFLLPAELSLVKVLIQHKNIGGDVARNYQHLQEYGEFGDKQSVQFLGYKEKINRGNMFRKFVNLKEFTIIRSEEMGGSFSYELNGKMMTIKRSSVS